MRLSRYGLLTILIFALLGCPPSAFCEKKSDYALTVYGAKVTENNWEEIVTQSDRLNFIDAKMLVVALSKRLGPYRPRLNYEIEGQVVKHFGIQDHWEFNALGVMRWEPFWWDRIVETSAAFGLGASYATEKPKAEIIIEGNTQKLMVYWMMELTLDLPYLENVDLVSRIHHRSEAFGLVADEGGSNSLAVGLKIHF